MQKEEKVYDNVEVHSMDELNQKQKVQNENKLPKRIAFVLAAMALIYDISPFDAISDAIPVLGWIDDFGLSTAAILNLYQQYADEANSKLIKWLKYAKWTLVGLVVVAGIAFGGLIAAIVAVVQK
ncbi:MAG: DUF1232 domain-containing protein [Fibrobacter sp.]|nr:DUF1232 domain-containing protein [Fibrobacter sp.]